MNNELDQCGATTTQGPSGYERCSMEADHDGPHSFETEFSPLAPQQLRTLVVNLWAGPGTGKSTNTALVFGKLKVAGVNAEIVHEFAKDLTWEERHVAIANQPYIMGKQQFHIERLFGKVDVIVTDSPLPFGLVYRGPAYTHALGDHIVETFKGWNTLNVFLERNIEHHPYNEAGRHQSLDEAIKVDQQIRSVLVDYGFTFYPVPILDGEKTADEIVNLVLERRARDRE